MSNIYTSVEQLVGNTPIIELKNIKNKFNLKTRILAKLEYFNPAGSSKDRVAKAIIEDAENRGLLRPGGVIIEPTSGNTGIGLASIAAAKGYRTIIVMPDTMSAERIKIMKAYGAQVILTDGKLGMNGAIQEAKKLSENIPNSFIAGQFENPVNPMAHLNSTGPEIYRDTDGGVDFFVCAVGTGGTISGTGEYLKSKIKNLKIVAVEPLSSPVLSKGKSGTHKIQGIGAGFIPKNLNTSIYDEIIAIDDQDALKYGRMMGECEGILVGISSGAALKAAITVAQRQENYGKTIVTLFPDSGDRYLSTEMFNF